MSNLLSTAGDRLAHPTEAHNVDKVKKDMNDTLRDEWVGKPPYHKVDDALNKLEEYNKKVKRFYMVAGGCFENKEAPPAFPGATNFYKNALLHHVMALTMRQKIRNLHTLHQITDHLPGGGLSLVSIEPRYEDISLQVCRERGIEPIPDYADLKRDVKEGDFLFMPFPRQDMTQGFDGNKAYIIFSNWQPPLDKYEMLQGFPFGNEVGQELKHLAIYRLKNLP
ncbi:MAG: hypothetical protein Q9162_005777 [Coniocarpon cinnabarinum]